MNWIPLCIIFRSGYVIGYVVDRDDADLVVRQFSDGDLPETLSSHKVRCRDALPWAIRTQEVMMIHQGLPPQQEAVQSQKTPQLPFPPLHGRS